MQTVSLPLWQLMMYLLGGMVLGIILYVVLKDRIIQTIGKLMRNPKLTQIIIFVVAVIWFAAMIYSWWITDTWPWPIRM